MCGAIEAMRSGPIGFSWRRVWRKMESMTKGGAERTRRNEEAERESSYGSPLGIVYDGDSADHELSKLMSSLERQFGDFDDDKGTLNFMGKKMNVAEEESSCQNFDKENVVSDDRNEIRPAPHRSRGSVQVTATSRSIDFNRLASIKPQGRCPSSSLYKSITTVLKKNVNRAGNESRIVDDFWSTEMEKKISAVSRRKLLTGINPPAQVTKPKAVDVEDRNVRHARSRRGGGNSRTLGRRRIRLDLRLDAAKFSEWDQETLAEEEVPPSTGGYSGRPAAGDSSCSFPGTKLGPGHSPPEEVLELSGRVKYAPLGQTHLQGAGSAHSGFSVPEGNLQSRGSLLTSPTPPLNPVATSMSLRHDEIRQRRLSFLSSSSGEGIDMGGGRKESGDNVLQHSQEESFGEVLVANENEAQLLLDEFQEAGDFEAAPPSLDSHQNNPLTESLTGADGKQQERAKRRARETQYNLGGCTWKQGRRKSQRIRAREIQYNLEGCGSAWNQGRRKSQRIRVGPLEWWRGEKVLYATHDSLMTIVGISRR